MERNRSHFDRNQRDRRYYQRRDQRDRSHYQYRDEEYSHRSHYSYRDERSSSYSHRSIHPYYGREYREARTEDRSSRHHVPDTFERLTIEIERDAPEKRRLFRQLDDTIPGVERSLTIMERQLEELEEVSDALKMTNYVEKSLIIKESLEAIKEKREVPHEVEEVEQAYRWCKTGFRGAKQHSFLARLLRERRDTIYHTIGDMHQTLRTIGRLAINEDDRAKLEERRNKIDNNLKRTLAQRRTKLNELEQEFSFASREELRQGVTFKPQERDEIKKWIIGKKAEKEKLEKEAEHALDKLYNE